MSLYALRARSVLDGLKDKRALCGHVSRRAPADKRARPPWAAGECFLAPWRGRRLCACGRPVRRGAVAAPAVPARIKLAGRGRSAQFDITFPALPCEWLSLDAMDISGEMHLDVVRALQAPRSPYGPGATLLRQQT